MQDKDIGMLKNLVDKIIPITRIKKNRDKINAGSFSIDLLLMSELIPFTEYVKHGLKFNIAVAIDFFL